MTKEFQPELKNKIKAGIKPSHLKRSKSADDITPPQPPSSLLLDQLKEKQQEVENLREKLEIKNLELTQTQEQLDNSFQARYEALKDFAKLHNLWKRSERETDRTVDEASTEIIQQAEKISELRNQLNQLKTEKHSLQWEVDVSKRLARLRNYSPASNSHYLSYALYGLALITLALWLFKKPPYE